MAPSSRSSILKCGFEEITHELVFSENVAVKEGKQMANSRKHVHDIKERNRKNFTALCWPSRKQATGKPYKIKLKVISFCYECLP